MSSLFGTLWTAKSALFANQLSLQTASNNVANAGTKGYSRQRVDLAESVPETLPFGQVGTGVTVDGVRRIRDQFLDQQYLRAERSLAETEAQHGTWAQIEAILGEPSDTGLQADMDRLFASLQDLASYPTDLTTKRTVLEEAQVLTGNFNRLDADLDALTRNLESEIRARVEEANGILQELADLHRQIQVVTASGQSPNALLDQRDLLLDNLTALIGVTRFIREDGTVVVTLAGGGGVILEGVNAATLGTQYAAATDSYDFTLNGIVVTPAGGKITGLLDSRNDPTGYVKYARTQLDTLAATLAAEFNRIQGLNAFFTGSTARTLAVNPELLARPELLAAGYPDPATGIVGGADNRAALDMVAIREATLLNGGTATLQEFYAATVGVVGARTAATANQAESQDLVVKTIQNQREMISGVSIDEEMTDLVRFQRAFEASSRVIRVVDELLSTVVNELIV